MAEGAAAAFRALAMGRRSARKFAEAGPIPADVLSEVLAITRRAPSSFNMQPWTCVIVQSKDQRELLGRAMLSESNRRRVVEAPATAVFAADLEPAALLPRLERLHEGSFSARALEDLTIAAGYAASGGRLASLLKGAVAHLASPLVPAPFPERAEEWAVKSAMLAAQSYIFAAASHGLATAPMEGFDASRVRLYLDVPPRYSIPLVVPTGFPSPDDQDRPLSPRFPPEDLFFQDSFGEPFSFTAAGEDDASAPGHDDETSSAR